MSELIRERKLAITSSMRLKLSKKEDGDLGRRDGDAFILSQG